MLNIPQAETIRLAVFASLLVAFLLLQYLKPRRSLPAARWRGQINNIALVGLGTLLIRLVLPLSVLAVAESQLNNFGLLPRLGIDGWLAMVVALVLLDCAIYWQHRLFHMVPMLWRLHRVHHSDAGFEVTTAIRFHPLELLLSAALKIALVLLLGADASSVLVFEILLSSSSLFTHSNLALPVKLDSALRWVLVTPDMHRIHHSDKANEHNSNYGFSLSLWDRLFASYTKHPQAGHRQMTIGLAGLADGNITRLLLMPLFSRTPAETKGE